MKIYRVEAPDGSILQIEGPENASQDQILQAAAAAFAQRQATQQNELQPDQQSAPENQPSGFLQGVGNLAGGMVSGVGKIGNTLWRPVDAAARALGVQNQFVGQEPGARNAAMAQELRNMGANPNAWQFKGGEILGQTLATAPVPGAVASGLARAAPGLVAPATVEALRSGGMAGGDLLTRMAGGAAAGGIQAAMINPEEATTGALIGGALPGAGALVRALGRTGRTITGNIAGVGDEPLRTAFETGIEGGAAGQAFRQNMRGQVPITNVLEDARQNLSNLRQARSAAYQQNMGSVREIRQTIPFKPVDDALRNVVNDFTFEGVPKNPQVASALESVSNVIDEWRQFPPGRFHTPIGLDALKQRIGAIEEALPIEANAPREAVSRVYDSIWREISDRAPDYAKAMADYEEASRLIKETQRSLLGNSNASADTAMRKLQSLMRNNVNTNYGARLATAEALESQGGRQIMPQLAGQALNNWMPRSIQGGAVGVGVPVLAFLGNAPSAAGLAAVSSPRLMGETFHAAGRVAGATDPLVQALRQGAYRAAPVIGAQ